MSMIQERSIDNSLVSHNPLDNLPREKLFQVGPIGQAIHPLFDQDYTRKITETAQDIIETTFSQLSNILPYEQLDDLIAHDLLKVKDSVPALIFLDVDGVLNTSASLRIRSPAPKTHHEQVLDMFDEQCLENLFNILEKVPDAKLVISSSWRSENPEDLLMNALTTKLGKYSSRIEGTTKHSSSGHRGLEVAEYLLSNYRFKEVRMVILDDESDFFPHQLPFLIQTDHDYGLTETFAYRAVERLKQKVLI